jgi:hypothetical protein
LIGAQHARIRRQELGREETAGHQSKQKLLHLIVLVLANMACPSNGMRLGESVVKAGQIAYSPACGVTLAAASFG